MYKDSINAKLMSLYNTVGLEKTVQVARKILASDSHRDDRNFRATLSGEICESILEILISDYKRSHPNSTKDWILCKGAILKNKSTEESEVQEDSNFLTELDVTLFTPEMIYLFECKSYKGKKYLDDKGILHNDRGKTFDVYSQSRLHEEILWKNIYQFRTKTPGKDMQLVMFNFSLGDLSDKRTDVDKVDMLCLNENNLFKLFTLHEVHLGKTKWDMRFIKQFVDIVNEHSPKLRQKHLLYVKSIHGKE